MTEPTAEQIEAERERAHAVLDLLHMWCEPTVDDAPHDLDCTLIATALARVRIETHAAGLKKAEKLLRARADVAYVVTDLVAPQLRKALHAAADAIRALRGRT